MANIMLLNLLRQNHTGKDKAIRRRTLVKMIYEPKAGKYAPWTEKDIELAERTLREEISEMNKEGIPILSGDDGIYYSQDPDDIDRIASRYFAMGTETTQKGLALSNCAKKLKESKEQNNIFIS